MKSREGTIENLKRYWAVFASKSLFLYLLLSLVVTLLDGVGIAVFFPVLTAVSSSDAGAQSGKLVQAVRHFMESLGLSFQMTTVLAMMAGLLLLKGIVQFSAATYQAWIATRFFRETNEKLVRGFGTLRYRYFLTLDTGVLTNLVVNESLNSTIAFTRFVMVFPPLITITALGAIAFRYQWKVAVISLGFGFALWIVMKGIAKAAREASIENTAATGSLTHWLVQSLSSFKYLAGTGVYEPVRDRLIALIGKVSSSQFKRSLTSISIQSINEPAVGCFLIFLIWYHVVLGGQSIADVLVLAVLFYRLLKEVMSLQSNWQSFSAFTGSVDLVISILNSLRDEKEKTGTASVHPLKRSLELKNITFAYDESPVLSNVNVTVPCNGTVAFVGESGAGKSTIVDLLTGLLAPQSGAVAWDGVDYRELDLKALRSRIGYVTQDSALFDDTIARNISMWKCADSADPAFDQVKSSATLANAAKFIETMPDQYETRLGDRASRVSGGQKQRISIARELFKQPWLLILDEATSALDPESEREVQKSIDSLKGNLTLVIIAHRLSTVRNVDKIYVMKDGRVIEEGSFKELASREDSHFANLCSIQGVKVSD